MARNRIDSRPWSGIAIIGLTYPAYIVYILIERCHCTGIGGVTGILPDTWYVDGARMPPGMKRGGTVKSTAPALGQNVPGLNFHIME